MSLDRELQTLPGFREFAPAKFQNQRYLTETWERIARRYAFARWEAPTVEPTELYRRKSGGELAGQLFAWTDAGEREIALRPELTPSLARLAALSQRDYKRPFKWHQFGPCFRYEKPQRGRLREFWQWNCDILGEPGPLADAELMALALDCCRAFGFDETHLELRLSDRRLWDHFLSARGLASKTAEFLAVIDRLDKEKPEALDLRLQAIGLDLATVQDFLENPGAGARELLTPVLAELDARGLAGFVRIEPRVVRGLAYYTGTVWELFDKNHGLRAVAGGGRYDTLAATLTGGKIDLPAVGFGMGDAVIAELIAATPAADARRQSWLSAQTLADAAVIVASEERRAQAVTLAQQLRDHGFAVDLPLAAAKVGKQFQRAEDLKARAAVVVGAEWPWVNLKDLATREERPIQADEAPGQLGALLASRDSRRIDDGNPSGRLA